MATTESVSFKLSELPSVWANSKRSWASGRADFSFIRHVRETGRGSDGTVHLRSDVQTPSFGFHGAHHRFQFLIAAFHDLHDARIKTAPFFSAEVAHGFFRGHGPAIGALRGQGIKTIHGGENAGPDGDGFAFQAIRVT